MGKEAHTDLTKLTYIQRSGPTQVGSSSESISTRSLHEVYTQNVLSICWKCIYQVYLNPRFNNHSFCSYIQCILKFSEDLGVLCHLKCYQCFTAWGCGLQGHTPSLALPPLLFSFLFLTTVPLTCPSSHF